jgi:hypothetical protein
MILHFAYPVYYAIQSKEVKEYQHRLLSESQEELKVLRIPLIDFEKARTGDELSINGEMYDIAAVHYEADIVICTVLRDSKETTLNKNLANHINNTTKKPRSCKQLVFWGPVSCTVAMYTPYTIFQPVKATYSISSSQFILNGHIPNIVQPPEMV